MSKRHFIVFIAVLFVSISSFAQKNKNSYQFNIDPDQRGNNGENNRWRSFLDGRAFHAKLWREIL